VNPVVRRTGTTATDTYRTAARQWTTGVALLTAQHGDEVFAKTVSSLCTLSLKPLLVSVAVDRRSPLTAAVRTSGRYALSVLSRDQEELARRFAAPGTGRAFGFFTGLPTRYGETGAPLLEECLSWFDCRLHCVLPAGDHVLLVGRVVAADGRPGDPLLYHDGGFHAIGDRGGLDSRGSAGSFDSRGSTDSRDRPNTTTGAPT
jgi:flavin reductase (DIM6/NTAB) family NADH-FMN oxidoreductase RutF